MRRIDREIKDRAEILDILQRCSTVRIVMQGEEYPYAVPVSFGMEVVDNTPVIYFHCAPVGKKADLLRKNGHVCVEGDIFLRTEQTPHGITTRYESVIGFGECSFVTDPEEIRHGMKLVIDHYGYNDYPLDSCGGMQHLLVGRVELKELTGKHNLPDTLTAADEAARKFM